MKLLGEGGLFTELKERRFAQFLGVYFAVAWGVLEVIDQLAQNDIFPPLVYRVALTLGLCGTPGVLIVTWFHGRRGDQKMPRAEKVLIGLVTVLALSVSGFVVRTGLASSAPGPRAVTLAPWEDPVRVAVLYFESRGGGDEAEAIAAGLTEGLIDQLSAVDTLHVVSSNGSRLVQGSALPDDSIARTLGVGTLVRGTLTVADNRVRVNISMIEGSGGDQFGSKTIETPRANLFELQDSLAAQVAIFLRGQIGKEVERVEQSSGTEVVRAWELVQQAERISLDAQQLAATGDVEGALEEMARADKLLEEAERLDPNWTLPIARRGWYAYRSARFFGTATQPQDEPTKRAIGHAERALALNPKDPDGLELRGTVKYWRMLTRLVEPGQEEALRDEAEADLLAATLENRRPAAALASLSHLLMNLGDIPQAKLKAVSSYEADPFLANADVTLWRLASSSWDLGSSSEAEKWCREGQRRFPGDYRFQLCGVMLYALKDYPSNVPAAWEAMRRSVELSPAGLRQYNEKLGHMYMAMALVRANLPDSAKAVALRGRAGRDIDPLGDAARLEAIARFFLARQYEEKGQQEAAAEQWDMGIQQLGVFLAASPSRLAGYRNEAQTGHIDNWYLEGLINQPKFRALVGVR